MKFQIVALSALLSFTTAQNLGAEPACATSCISSAITAAGCAPTDQACQCGPTQASIGALAAPCLLTACPATALAAVQSIGNALCAQYSAALTMSSMSITGSMTTEGAVSTSASATGSVSTSATTVLGNSTVVVVVSSSSSAATYGNSTSSGTSGSSVTGSSTGGAAGSSTSASAKATTTGSPAVANVVNAMGGLVAVFFGIIAAL